MRPFTNGRKDGALAAAAGLRANTYGDSYFNDAGAQMEYRDGYREGWHLWQQGQGVQLTDFVVMQGSTIKFLQNGRHAEAVITHIYEGLQRFDAELKTQDGDEWLYPNEGDRKVWGYLSDILEVTQF